jgi:putative spermidine/putrescine transport system permease protein
MAQPERRSVVSAEGDRRRPHRFGQALLLIAATPIFLYLVLPSFVVVPMALTKGQLIKFPPDWISLHSFSDYFNDAQWIAATMTSFKVAGVAMVIACVTGALAALALHGPKSAGKGVIVSLLLAPIVIPLVVLALADYLLFARFQLVGNWLAIGLAHSLLVTPYVFITVQASLVGLDPALVRSARSLGAGPLSLLRYVYWPVVRPGIAAGAIFAFAVSFDEVVIALFLQGPEAITLPVKMFTSIQYDLTPKIAAVASLLLCVAALALTAQSLLAVWRPEVRRMIRPREASP